MADRDRRRGGDDAIRITTAAPSPAEDTAARQRRYLFSMGVRTICFVGAVIVDGWLRWVLIAAAIVLPYIAVVAANAVSGPREPAALPELGGDRRPLPGPPD
jgi:hypothetical protein